MAKHKIVGLDGCNAYMRCEYDAYYATIELISYASRVARVVVSGSCTTCWYLDPAATCSATTIRQVKRFFDLLNGRVINGVKVDISTSAYNALRVGNVQALVNGSYGYYDHACSYAGATTYDAEGNRLQRAGCNCTDISGHFEPRREFVNDNYVIKTASVGAWHTW